MTRHQEPQALHRRAAAWFMGLLVLVAGVTPFETSNPTPMSTLFRPPRSLMTRTHPSLHPTRSERIKSFLQKLSFSSGRKNDRWRAGEVEASIPSRLLFRYVSPLLDLASKRTLTEEDAFLTPACQSMETSIDSLAECYEGVRANSRKQIELQRATEGGVKKMKHSQSILLLKALLKQNKETLIFTGILRLINTFVQAFPAILVARLLRGIEAGNALPARHAMQSAFLLMTVLMTKMVTENQLFHNVVNMSTGVRGSLEGLIFDKSLRLPEGGSGVLAKRSKGDEKKALGSGGVLNLMQTDATTIESAAMQIHTIWDGPLQIAMYTYLLYEYLGSSVFWGLGVLLSIIPLNSITLRILDRLSRFENEARDARTKRTTESINNMKLLKVQAWESEFANDIRRHRKDEIERHKMRGVVRALNSAISNAVPALVLVVTLTAYAKTGRPIVASTVFTAISLFNQLRFPLFFYPMLIDSLANGKNALKRISAYLTSEEVTPYVERLPATTEGGSIEMKNGSFLWSTSQAPKGGEIASPEAPALCNINVKVNPGEIVAVVGPVGSGKSALVKGLLGELAPVPRTVVDRTASGETGTEIDDAFLRPSVVVTGNIAYCSQEAWLPKGTIRDAIVFGRDYNEERYLQAIYDAGLEKDIGSSGTLSATGPSHSVLSHDTDVGEGGSNLSGGQRARVALARALYSGDDTKVFLLDDCFAALDASVGSMVFERVSKRLKASNAATVLVTNDPSLPRRCDAVILMGSMGGRKQGPSSSCSTIVDVGTYDELLAGGHDLQSFSVSDEECDDNIDTHVPMFEESGTETQDPDSKPELIRVVGGYKVRTNGTDHCVGDPNCEEVDLQTNPEYLAERIIAEPDEGTVKVEDSTDGGRSDEEKAHPAAKQLSTDDKMSTEAVPLSTYWGYLKAVQSPRLIAAMIFAFVTANGAQFFQQYTVAKWTELAGGNAMVSALGGRYLRSLVYAAGVVSLFLWLRSYFTMLVGARASTFYHDRMVSSVFQAPMSFFDSTPSGQILSRFGKEIGIIDRALPDSFASVLFCALQIGSSAMALAGAITPAMMVPLSLAGWMYIQKMRKFRPAARDMKRADTKTRSPIFTHFAEALRGTEIIRSIPGASETWSRGHRHMSDENLAVYSTVKALDRWLSCNLETMGNVMVFTTAVSSVILSRAGRLQPGSAGWGLTQSLAITGLMAWAVRNLTLLESHMMSVMRVRDLDAEEGMPRELAEPGEAIRVLSSTESIAVVPVNEDSLKNSGWPWSGGIRFNHVSMRYNPSSPLVLDEIDLSIPPGSTLGVVGRTGSGKSSLLLTLFRIVEIAKGGSIEIDGVDIRSVSIQTLRERLSIIPQDPVLFAGTLGDNLDALGKSSPEEMWVALESASPELAEQFHSSGGLETPISEGGNNLSQGQRQLICLARALLRKSKVLVLDEATSNVDAKTDQQVQDTIRREFVENGVSVITVAHRLDTVLGYDKIAVLGDGKLLEYGKPGNLLKVRNGELRRLVDADRLNKRKGGQRTTGATVTA